MHFENSLITSNCTLATEKILYIYKMLFLETFNQMMNQHTESNF